MVVHGARPARPDAAPCTRTWNFVATMPDRCDALGPDLDAVESERRDGVAHALERQAEVEQRADGHVAADA